MITIGNIVDFLNADKSFHKFSENSTCVPIARPASITGAQPGDVTFCGATAKNPLKLLSKTRASLILMDGNMSIDEANLDQSVVQAVIFSDNARLDFIRVVEHFFVQQHPTGIHSSAVIASSAIIASDVTIGPLCTIDGEVAIGADTVIYAGVHIYDHTCIGKNAIIHSGTVIGKDGWGYERNKLGKLEKFPHIGTVKIGNDVEIGSNVVIDRGTLVKTVIGDGCKINNGTHIGHNAEIGEDTIILPLSYLGGSCKVGSRCWIGPRSSVRDQIEIGSDVFVGMGSVVTKNIPNGVTVMGSPAREIGDQKKLLEHWSDIIAQAEHG